MGVTRLRLSRWMRLLAIASLTANIGIVVSGGAVRLTGSGLGCPTWPRCTEASFVPHGELGIHGVIEFGNRMLTIVLIAVAIATWLAALAQQPRRAALVGPATVLALGVPGQAVVGGLTVLTDLNPWIVSLHLMLSMLLIAVAVVLVRRTVAPPSAEFSPLLRALTTSVLGVAFFVLYVGTIVTGSGPHAGDRNSPRNGLDPELLSHVHAAVVYLLAALTLVSFVVARRSRTSDEVRRAVGALLALEVAQGAIGFTQYYLDLPELLVGLHLLGAALLAATATWLWLATHAARSAPPPTASSRSAGQPVSKASRATATKSSAR